MPEEIANWIKKTNKKNEILQRRVENLYLLKIYHVLAYDLKNEMATLPFACGQGRFCETKNRTEIWLTLARAGSERMPQQ